MHLIILFFRTGKRDANLLFPEIAKSGAIFASTAPKLYECTARGAWKQSSLPGNRLRHLISGRRSFMLASRTILGFAQSSEGRNIKCGRKDRANLLFPGAEKSRAIFSRADPKLYENTARGPPEKSNSTVNCRKTPYSSLSLSNCVKSRESSAPPARWPPTC